MASKGQSFDFRTHIYKIDPKSGAAVIDRTQPYKRLVARGRPTLMLRDGKYFYEDGVELSEAKLAEFGLKAGADTKEAVIMTPPKEVQDILEVRSKEAQIDWAIKAAETSHRV